jgi:hypothetical protein
MKQILGVLLFAFASLGSLCAQQSVTINEPSEQCYQDLKANLPEAIRWDDSQRMVQSKPLQALHAGSVQIYARILQEAVDTKWKLVVGYDSTEHPTTLNAAADNSLFRNAHLLAARIDSARKAREKDEKKKAKEQEKK